MGQESLPECWEGSGGLVEVRSPTQSARRGWLVLPEGREGLGVPINRS